MVPPSSSDNIGDDLIAQGWKQGSLLPALAHLVLFDPDHPFAPALKKQATFQPVTPPAETPRFAYCGLFPPPDYRQVLISQTCDIARPMNIEPMVVAARAQIVKAGPRLEEAKSSVRFFLLNESTGLVVDISYLTQIEKPLLLTLGSPEFGPTDEEVAREFRYWIGNRFSRPAFPQPFVDAVSGRIRDRMRELIRERSPLIEVRKYIIDVRTVMPPAVPPYDSEIVVLLTPTESDVEEQAFKTGVAALFGELMKGIDKGDASGVTVVPLLANEWSVAEYLATEPLDLAMDFAGE